MKEFWVRVPDHAEFDPAERLKVRAKLTGFGHPTKGVEFDAQVLDWWGGLKYSLYTTVRLKVIGRDENLGNKPVWLVEVLNGGRKPDEPKPAELFR